MSSNLVVDNYSKVTVKRLRVTELTTNGLSLNGSEPTLNLLSNVLVSVPNSNLQVGRSDQHATLNVYGTTTANILVARDVLEAVTANITTLNLSGSLGISELTVSNDASFSSNITVGGTSNVTGEATFGSNVTIGGDLQVDGSLRVATLVSDNQSQEITSEVFNVINDADDVRWAFKVLTSGNLALYKDDVLKFEWAP